MHKSSGARLTIYADDITLWTERNDYPTTEDASLNLQAALFALENAIQAAGMHPSPEKSALLLSGGKKQEKQKVHLYLENQEIPQSSQGWIRILGIPISHKGNATELIRQVRQGWDATAHLIHRIGSKFGGAGTALIRNVGRAILTSRLTYEGTCFNLTQTQLKKIRTLHLKLLRVINGLPRHTKLNDLYTFASLPPIEATLKAARDNHSDRRELAVQGRRLIVYDETRTFTLGSARDPSSTPNPPWQWTQSVNYKPRLWG